MSKMSHVSAFVLLGTLASVSSCVLAADVKPAAEASSALEIHLIVTAKGRELFNSWNRPTRKSFQVEPVKVAERGPFLSAVVLFKGCRPDAAGNCDVDLDIVAYDPKGKVYGEMKGVELWKQKPAPDRDYTQLGMDYMGIVIEPQDPSGTYRVTAVARDRNARSEAKSTASFEVK